MWGGLEDGKVFSVSNKSHSLERLYPNAALNAPPSHCFFEQRQVLLEG